MRPYITKQIISSLNPYILLRGKCFGISIERSIAALVILNKDNSEGLRRTLESLSKQSCKPCRCFDIYVVDGGSKDDSLSVAKEMASRIPCIYWVEQSVKGGTGPARIEIIEILRRRGYRYIIWGDSENIYSEQYVERILRLLESGCDIASGRSVVIRRSIWSEAFYWYHSFHNIFPRFVGSKHAPGNNMGSKIWVYDLATYPPSRRSDDYIFTFSLLRISSPRPRYCIDEDAVIYIDMPNSFSGVIGWQRSRVLGLVEGSLYIGLRAPPDLISWSAPLALLAIIVALSVYYLSPTPLAIPILSMISLALFLQIKSRRYLDRATPLTGLVALVGVILHSIFTTAYSLGWMARIYIFEGINKHIEYMRDAEKRARMASADEVRL